jgi:hypothetical protein
MEDGGWKMKDGGWRMEDAHIEKPLAEVCSVLRGCDDAIDHDAMHKDRSGSACSRMLHFFNVGSVLHMMLHFFNARICIYSPA